VKYRAPTVQRLDPRGVVRLLHRNTPAARDALLICYRSTPAGPVLMWTNGGTVYNVPGAPRWTPDAVPVPPVWHSTQEG
jgi:hypothetical protein